MTDEHRIRYRFTFKDGSQETFDLEPGPTGSLVLDDALRADPPTWTQLAFHKCPNCPLPAGEAALCPAAASLVNVVRGFSHVQSHEDVWVEVTTADRVISQEVPAQRGVGSLMGLIMALSGCPHTAFFRPMARFHAPWASEEETIYRAASMYLLAQYLLKVEGRRSDPGLEGLSRIYDNVRKVNRAFVERLRAASEQDSNINAIIVLDTLALTLPWAIGESLKELRHLFEPYFSDTT